MIAPLVIVGAGPAGIAAALAARDAGIDPVLLEAAALPGGQLHRVHSMLAGVPAVTGDGAVLAARLALELAAAGISIRPGAAVFGLASGAFGHTQVMMGASPPLEARAVLVASGLRARKLGIPGEREFLGAGVSTSATRDRGLFAGKSVVVVGGGDAAYENALLLAAAGCRVALVIREAPRAREEFRGRVADQPAIVVTPRTSLRAIIGDSRVTGVVLAGPSVDREIPADGVIIKAGSIPNTEWCGAGIDRDGEGYLRVDARGATSMPGVWAAGDVTRPASLTVAAASASARLAVAAIGEFLGGKRSSP